MAKRSINDLIGPLDSRYKWLDESNESFLAVQIECMVATCTMEKIRGFAKIKNGILFIR